jgi:flagellar biosynthetic protein FliR
VFVGFALGFVTYLLFAGVQAAGDLIDLFGGFQLASAYDPLSQNQNSVFGKLTSQLATMLLFALGGHLLIVQGFERSYDAIPLTAGLDPARLEHVVTVGVSQLFLSALEISAPLVGVLFIVDVGLGLLTRMAPALNAFSLSFPAKIFVTLALFGLVIPLYPGAVRTVTENGLDAVAALYRRG